MQPQPPPPRAPIELLPDGILTPGIARHLSGRDLLAMSGASRALRRAAERATLPLLEVFPEHDPDEEGPPAPRRELEALVAALERRRIGGCERLRANAGDPLGARALRAAGAAASPPSELYVKGPARALAAALIDGRAGRAARSLRLQRSSRDDGAGAADLGAIARACPAADSVVLDGLGPRAYAAPLPGGAWAGVREIAVLEWGNGGAVEIAALPRPLPALRALRLDGALSGDVELARLYPRLERLALASPTDAGPALRAAADLAALGRPIDLELDLEEEVGDELAELVEALLSDPAARALRSLGITNADLDGWLVDALRGADPAVPVHLGTINVDASDLPPVETLACPPPRRLSLTLAGRSAPRRAVERLGRWLSAGAAGGARVSIGIRSWDDGRAEEEEDDGWTVDLARDGWAVDLARAAGIGVAAWERGPPIAARLAPEEAAALPAGAIRRATYRVGRDADRDGEAIVAAFRGAIAPGRPLPEIELVGFRARMARTRIMELWPALAARVAWR